MQLPLLIHLLAVVLPSSPAAPSSLAAPIPSANCHRVSLLAGVDAHIQYHTVQVYLPQAEVVQGQLVSAASALGLKSQQSLLAVCLMQLQKLLPQHMCRASPGVAALGQR